MVIEIDSLQPTAVNILHLKIAISEIAKTFLEVAKLMVKEVEKEA